jgi:hypothetical protein
LVGACEREFVPDIVPTERRIVVEGYIEAGQRPQPPVVILTRDVPFFQDLDGGALSNLFVRDALVAVDDGERRVFLSEVCLEQLNAEQRELAGELFGLDLEALGFNFCAYTDLGFSMLGREGKTYRLSVLADGERLEAITSIPQRVPLTGLRFIQPPGEPNDTLAQLRCRIVDPPGVPNFYRYFIAVNNGPFLAGINSVVDDRLFDGRDFEFPLPRPQARGADFDPATFGLYRRGDTVTVKWVSLDEAHFRFWNTLEFNAVNQGPFSSYTRVASNVEGGLGIWGGLAAEYYTLIVPE